LKATRILGIKDVIYVASGSIYGVNTPSRKGFSDTPSKPENIYPTIELCSELLDIQALIDLKNAPEKLG